MAPRSEPGDRAQYLGLVHVVYFLTAPDAGKQRDGQFAAQVLAEFCEPNQQRRPPVGGPRL